MSAQFYFHLNNKKIILCRSNVENKEKNGLKNGTQPLACPKFTYSLRKLNEMRCPKNNIFFDFFKFIFLLSNAFVYLILTVPNVFLLRHFLLSF